MSESVTTHPRQSTNIERPGGCWRTRLNSPACCKAAVSARLIWGATRRPWPQTKRRWPYQYLAAVHRALARTLQNRRCQPAGPGRNQEALGAKEEALALYRNLAATNPGLYEKTYQRLVSNARIAG
jgi:hypothetical protein